MSLNVQTDELSGGALALEGSVVEGVGRLMEFWGFRRHLGRLWAVLYLSPEPLATPELAERLQLSASAVSLTITELSQWGAVRKTKVPGDRRDFYLAETSIWRLITRVVRQRELTLVRDTAELLDRALSSIDAARDDGEIDRARARFLTRRVRRLRLLAGVGEKLLGAFLVGAPLDPAEVREVGARDEQDEALQ